MDLHRLRGVRKARYLKQNLFDAMSLTEVNFFRTRREPTVRRDA